MVVAEKPAQNFRANILSQSQDFLTYETEFVLFLAVLENYVLLRQLTKDTKSDVSCLQTLLTRRNKKLRMTFGVGHYTMLIVNIVKDLFPCW